jgi:hypothetical protein
VPSANERVRKEAASDPFLIYQFYDNVEREIDRLDLSASPQSIYNLDESAFFTDPSRGRVVGETGTRAHRTTSGNGRECFTALATVNAAGRHLPPLIIFKGKHFYSSWAGQHALPGTTYAISGKSRLDSHYYCFTYFHFFLLFSTLSEKGWITRDIFVAWFKNSFLCSVTERPLLLILDGHISHLGLSFIHLA